MANALIIYRDKVKTNSWARWMISRTMKQNRNNLIALVGKTGSGKTWSAMSVCEIMERMDGVPFTIDHIVFSLKELMDLINSGKLKRGSKVVFDEPQVSISAREFQSQANKIFNYLLSTFRHRNLTLFFCTPFETLLDKNTRRLFHARFETMSINKNENTCKIKPRFVEYSDYKDKIYRKQMIVRSKDEYGNSKYKKLSNWDVPKPSKELIVQYEKKKLEFTNRLNQNISERLKKYDESGSSITSDNIPAKNKKPLTELQEKIVELWNKGITNQKKIGEIIGKDRTQINKNVKYIRNKGYTLDVSPRTYPPIQKPLPKITY